MLKSVRRNSRSTRDRGLGHDRRASEARRRARPPHRRNRPAIRCPLPALPPHHLRLPDVTTNIVSPRSPSSTIVVPAGEDTTSVSSASLFEVRLRQAREQRDDRERLRGLPSRATEPLFRLTRRATATAAAGPAASSPGCSGSSREAYPSTARRERQPPSSCVCGRSDRWSHPFGHYGLESHDRRLDDLAALLEERIVDPRRSLGRAPAGSRAHRGGLPRASGSPCHDPSDVKGDPDLLNLTRPDIVTELHRVPGGRRRHHHDEHVHRHLGRPGGLRADRRRLRHERRRRPPGEAGGRAARPRLGRRIDRPAQRHALHVTQGGRGVVPDDLVRSGVRGVRRADPRSSATGAPTSC